MRCRFHFAELLSFVHAPLAGSKAACTTLANILLKAHILNVSDKEKSWGCLRSKGVNPCYKVGGTFSQLVRGTYPTKFIDSCLSNLIKVDP